MHLFKKCVSVNSKQCLSRPTTNGLNSNYLSYHLFIITLDWFNLICNTLYDFSSIICTPNKIEDVTLHVFNMITIRNEPKTKHISWNCKSKFHGRKRISNENWNKESCRWECKNAIKHHVCKKYYIWNSSTYAWKTVKYFKIIIGDPVDTFDETVSMPELSL